MYVRGGEVYSMGRACMYGGRGGLIKWKGMYVCEGRFNQMEGNVCMLGAVRFNQMEENVCMLGAGRFNQMEENVCMWGEV